MPVEIEALGARVFRDRIEDAILEALSVGDLQPGDQVKEAEIAMQAGISRGPVREAIQRLVGEEILVYHPHRGTFVAEWASADIREIYSIRGLLEGYAAGLAVRRMTEAQLNELSLIIEQMVQKAKAGDIEGVFELDLTFHQSVNDLAGHKLLSKLLANIHRRISLYIKLDEESTPNLDQYAQNHYLLLESMKSRDAGKAEAVFREHLETVGKGLAARFEQRSVARKAPNITI